MTPIYRNIYIYRDIYIQKYKYIYTIPATLMRISGMDNGMEYIQKYVYIEIYIYI